MALARGRVSTRSSTVPARTSVQRSGRGRPVTTVSRGSSAALDRGEAFLEHPGTGEPGRRQQPGHLVEDAEHLGHAAAVGVDVDQGGARVLARQAARAVATVVRPGAPAGPHTARTRPGTRGGARVGARRRLGLGLGAMIVSGSAARSSSAPDRADADAGRSDACLRQLAGRDRDGPDPARPQPVDGGEVEARRLEGDHGGVGLPGRGGGEEVVDVDAALEDHQVAATAEQAERRVSQSAPAARSRTTCVIRA